MSKNKRLKTFEKIHSDNSWNSEESVSGSGSTLEATVHLRRLLPKILKKISAQSMLDIPCGDFNWMKEVNLDGVKYTGADIVPEIIKRNKKNYSSDKRNFRCFDLCRDPLPKVDVIMCRDCLVHLSFKDIARAISNMKKSGSKYVFTTTFPGILFNQYIKTGEWRPINLEKGPFFFPPPIKLFNEGYHTGRYSAKSMALWKLSDIEIPDVSSYFPFRRLFRLMKNLALRILSRLQN